MKKCLVIVTGSASGLGHYLSNEFHQSGTDVVGIDISYESSGTLSENNATYRYYLADITDQENVVSILTEIGLSSYNVITLVNNAAPSSRIKNLPYHDPYQVDYIKLCFNTCCLAAHLMTSIVFQELEPFLFNKSKLIRLNIINIASILAERSTPVEPLGYGISKAALINLTRQQAIHLSCYGIAVNSISPGILDRNGSLLKQGAMEVVSCIPSKQPASYSDIWNICRGLHTGEITGITGHDFVIDGGLSLVEAYYSYTQGRLTNP